MVADCNPPDDAHAEINRQRAEQQRQYERMQDQTPDQLRAIAADSSESFDARFAAIGMLFQRSILERRDPNFADLLLVLFDDPVQDLWRATLRHYDQSDPRVKARLWQFLDGEDLRNSCEAAVALSRMKDEALLPTVLQWLNHPERRRRNVAIECLRNFNTAESRGHLHQVWNHGDHEDRFAAAIALLRLDDTTGLDFLKDTARTANGPRSACAVTWIYNYRRQDALPLALHVLDHGDDDAKRMMVGEISRCLSKTSPRPANVPDTFDDAHRWAQDQLTASAT